MVATRSKKSRSKSKSKSKSRSRSRSKSRSRSNSRSFAKGTRQYNEFMDAMRHPRPISVKQAQSRILKGWVLKRKLNPPRFEYSKRTKRGIIADLRQTRSKGVLAKPNEKWFLRPDLYDVKGIDAPPYKKAVGAYPPYANPLFARGKPRIRKHKSKSRSISREF